MTGTPVPARPKPKLFPSQVAAICMNVLILGLSAWGAFATR